jgi:hypothetical protein
MNIVKTKSGLFEADAGVLTPEKRLKALRTLTKTLGVEGDLPGLLGLEKRVEVVAQASTKKQHSSNPA